MHPLKILIRLRACLLFETNTRKRIIRSDDVVNQDEGASWDFCNLFRSSTPFSRHEELAHFTCKLRDRTDIEAGDVGKTGCGRLKAFQARDTRMFEVIQMSLRLLRALRGGIALQMSSWTYVVLTSGLKGCNKSPVDPLTLRGEPKRALKPRTPCAPSLDAVFDGLQ